jgi:flagellar biosynthesis/type III secretory pathway protein FliH
METNEMIATSKLLEEVQKGMAERYDKEFNEIRYFVDEAYSRGVEAGLKQGKDLAKQEIINLIQGGSDETGN